MATYDLTSITPSKIVTDDILNCPYSGSVQSITLPKGQYKLECWGAQGGTYNSAYTSGGAGGYTTGVLNLSNDTILYLYAGGQGSYGTTTTYTATAGGGFNGGGNAAYGGGGGGGASDIRIGTDSLYARVIVAGGGGGAYAYSTSYKAAGGVGGGTIGGAGSYYGSNYSSWVGGGGTSTAGGSAGTGSSTNYYGKTGSFGQGGNSGYKCSSASYFSNGAGGGGWYGGGSAGNYSSNSSTGRSRASGGGGGSGYAYTASSYSSYPSGCLLNSNYYLTEAATSNGTVSFLSPTGSSETGHTGNGYVRITAIKVKTGNAFLKKDSSNWLEQKQVFVNTGSSSTVPSGLVELDYITSTGSQYINTGITPNGNTRVECKFIPLDTGTQAVFCGGRTAVSGTNAYTNTMFYINQNIRRDYFGTSKTSTSTYATGTTMTIDANKNAVTINGSSSEIADFTLSTTTGQMPILLFCSAMYNTSTSAITNLDNYAKFKIYYYKIYNNGSLVRNFIPARRTSDGKCGLWDKVSYRFYVDENGGNFTAGSSVVGNIASPGTPIEYIESSGTQYINTGYVANANTKVIADFQITSQQSSNNDIFGVVGQFSFRQYGGSSYFRTISGTAIADFDTTVSILNRHTVEKTFSSTIIDNNYNKTTSGTATISYPLYLCAYNSGSSVSNYGYLKLYSCKIYDGNTLVRDFVPIKTAVNTYGLWDRVNKVFYKNSGTGTFTGGSATTLSGWKPAKGVWTKIDNTTWKQVL